MNDHVDHRATILGRMGLQVAGEHDLVPLVFSSLDDDQLINVMRCMAQGLPPSVDVAAFTITEEEWLRRQAERHPHLARTVDLDRRRRRKATKRRQRHR
jgi:hypothetical protein